MIRLTALALLALLPACQSYDVVCRAGTTKCNGGCADFSSDTRNCGACGIACQSSQVCVDSQCVCQAGTSPCNGRCVVTASDPANCGGCGVACPSGQVCEASQCKAGCALGTSSRCGDSCVDLQRDALNCGTCGAKCEAPQTCHQGRCSFDVVAACFTSGQVVGLEAAGQTRGPLEPLGSGPAALATYGEALLVADGIDRALLQARLASSNGHAFAQFPQLNRTGSAPNFVLADPPFVYVVNSGANTLQVLKQGAANDAGVTGDGGVLGSGGVALGTVGELNFGANTTPEVAVKLGGSLWVPLYGGFGASSAAAGQKVVQVDVSDPANPKVANTVDLAGLDLKAFDGGHPVPRPFAAVAHQGALFVALNNLDPDTYAPQGPGLLARVDPATRAVTVVDLGADACLNPVWLASTGDGLVVSCSGAARYDSNFALLGVEAAGVVTLDSALVRRSTWAARCPVADAGCAPPLPGRLAVQGGKVWVADQNAGRLFVLDVDGGVLTERRGLSGGAGPVQACAVDSVTGIANVGDVLAVP
ncbi:MAG: hypothetical protein K1X89_09700 [Myxococcaceae bacterium]|nr:hypothetical protein [Myxococcaceae bacterium]